MIQQVQIELLAKGGAGTSGCSERSTAITGLLHALHLAYGGAPAATTDLVIVAEGASGAPDRTILSLTNSATDAWHQPRVYQQDTVGNDLTYDATNEIPCEIPLYQNTIKVTVDGADNGNEIVVTLLYDDGS